MGPRRAAQRLHRQKHGRIVAAVSSSRQLKVFIRYAQKDGADLGGGTG